MLGDVEKCFTCGVLGAVKCGKNYIILGGDKEIKNDY